MSTEKWFIDDGTYVPFTTTTLNICCVVEFVWPNEMFIALSKLAANWYDKRSASSVLLSLPSYGTYKYGKTPWTCMHVFTPAESVPNIRSTGTCRKNENHKYIQKDECRAHGDEQNECVLPNPMSEWTSICEVICYCFITQRTNNGLTCFTSFPRNSE